MKLKFKKKYVIIFALLLVVSSVIVHAVDNPFTFTKTLSTKEQVNAYTAQFSNLYTLKDGVLKVDYEGNTDGYNFNEYRLTYLNKAGEIIRSEVLDSDYKFLYIGTDGENIYYTYYNSNLTSPYVIAVLDDEFKLLNEYHISSSDIFDNNYGFKIFKKFCPGYYGIYGYYFSYDCTSYGNNYITRFNDKGFYPIVSEEENIYINDLYGGRPHLIKINKDSNYELIRDEANVNELNKKYFPLIELMGDRSTENVYITDRFLYVNENKILSSSTNNGISSLKLTENDETIWEITNEENTYYYYSDLESIGTTLLQ